MLSDSIFQKFISPVSKNETLVLLHDQPKLKIAEVILKALNNLNISNYNIIDLYNLIEVPPNRKLGDYAFPTFQIAKILKTKPIEIGSRVLDLISESDSSLKVKIEGAYLNFELSSDLICDLILKPILNENLKLDNIIKNPSKCVIEYSQPNTHKELHVGHMRNMCLGLALVNIYKYLNFDIVTATFPGDVGTHVAKCLWYFKNYINDSYPDSNKGEWLGSLYPKAVKKYEELETTANFQNIQEEITLILKQLEQKKGDYYNLWLETREWSIEQLKEVYDWADISFDLWYWESEVDSQSIKLVQELYKQGKLDLSDGAIGMNLEEQGLGFCLLLKSDGNGLYATKDLLLAQKKFEDTDADKNIVIVDTRQSHHFKQVFATLNKIGFSKATDCYHLPYNYVELPDGPMSSRKGNIVAIKKLINEMEYKIKELYLSKYAGIWSHELIDSTAKAIAESAIKFGMNATEPNTKIIFDLENWLKLDTQSGPYVQYTCARIISLINRYAKECFDFDCKYLNSEIEKTLIFSLAEFRNIIISVASTLKTNLLTSHLLEVCRNFNRFYSDQQIISDKEEVTKAKIALCLATLNILREGLMLLGISVPEKM